MELNLKKNNHQSEMTGGILLSEMDGRYRMKQKNLSKNTSILGRDRFNLPKCLFCRNFQSDANDSFACKAFPNGIPDTAIWEDKDEECNNGIKFEKD